MSRKKPEADWRKVLREGEERERAERLKDLKRPAPKPCTPEEQAVLDRIGEKLAAKRAALAKEKP